MIIMKLITVIMLIIYDDDNDFDKDNDVDTYNANEVIHYNDSDYISGLMTVRMILISLLSSIMMIMNLLVNVYNHNLYQ